MSQDKETTRKFKEWLSRYIVAEILGTLIALAFAYVSFVHAHSYLVAAGAGFVGEGIGFYGYFTTLELMRNSKAYREFHLFKRLGMILSRSGANLIVEFAPAEIIDNIFIRPFLMYYMPQHIKPYAIGFIIGKFAADSLFYVFAIAGYEAKEYFARPKRG